MSMGYERARHLLTRTGFGPTHAEIERASKLEPEAAVAYLLGNARTQATLAPPPWTSEVPLLVARRAKIREARSRAEKQRLRRQTNAVASKRGLELKEWWFAEMTRTDSPLSERMTLFWHNHFTSSLKAVKSPVLLHRQNATLRLHALGNFRDMLRAITRDPAMIAYLDNRTNRKRKPNENFARELLELFTLGEGHYSEKDIKEAARAFTGWHIDMKTGGYRFNARQHDDGAKTFMGKTGNLGGDDIVDTILANPRASEYITERLWRAFISPDPDAWAVKRLAKVFRKADYELKPLMTALLTSPEMLDPQNVGVLIKSPVQLIVGTLRLFSIVPESSKVVTASSRRLGQDLFDPPNVKGWPGGQAWITTDTLLARQHLLSRLFREPENTPMIAEKGWDALLGKGFKGNPVAALQRVMLPIEPVFGEPDGGGPFASARHFVLDPAYQLL